MSPVQAERTLIATRVFDAPRALVWQMFTEAKHVQKWWPCPHLKMVVCELDFRVGGAWRNITQDSEGVENPLRGVYREILEPEKIVFTQIYDVEPWNKDEAIVTVTFDEIDGKTALRCEVEFGSTESHKGATDAGMEAGMYEAYDRVAHLLEEMKS